MPVSVGHLRAVARAVVIGVAVMLSAQHIFGVVRPLVLVLVAIRLIVTFPLPQSRVQRWRIVLHHIAAALILQVRIESARLVAEVDRHINYAVDRSFGAVSPGWYVVMVLFVSLRVRI